MVDASDLNPVGMFNFKLGTLGNVLLAVVIVIVILGSIGFLVWWRIHQKKFKYVIPLYKIMGNRPMRVGVYKARDFPIGKAGDKLWFVAKLKKFIQPATIQSAPDEFMHWEREDGEWINFAMGNLDEVQKNAGVRYIHQDMRAQRVATATILEQRLINKSFWDKYKDLVVNVIFFLITMICMVVIFWQWSKIVDKTGQLISTLDMILKRIENIEHPENSIVPVASSLFLFFKSKFGGKKE